MDNQIELKLENEIWRDIPNYERYQVSNLGRVKRKEWVIDATSKDGTEHIRILSEMILKPSNGNGQGHQKVTLIDEDGNKIQHYVHILVMSAFRGKPVVIHLDNDPTNNELSNLRYRSQKENIQQSVREGRHSSLMTSVDYTTNEFRRMIEGEQKENKTDKETQIMETMFDEFFGFLQENGIGVMIDE